MFAGVGLTGGRLLEVGSSDCMHDALHPLERRKV